MRWEDNSDLTYLLLHQVIRNVQVEMLSTSANLARITIARHLAEAVVDLGSSVAEDYTAVTSANTISQVASENQVF